MERETYTIDATGKALGRLASEIAIILQGKKKLGFLPHKDMGDFVIIKNVKAMKVSGQKMKKKKYYFHSGYLGGLKEKTLEEIFKKDPAKALKMAVSGMLPKNKLRKKMLKRLKIE